ncbi:MAG: methyltransferase domain-containing protein [Deltaproteobacteria bacterium]|nr:methyltransferase domain-containing protein [Deltaproteobacteria bacterium]
MDSQVGKNAHVGENIQAENASWSFGNGVAEGFSEHVRRSVPMYETGHALVCKLSDYFVKEDSICYEVGTSVGSLLMKLAEHNKNKKNAKWIGIDLEKDMIEKARKNIKGIKNVSLEVADVVHYEFEKTDLVICYYTVQFTLPKHRQQIINKIYEALNWGGALILFEKVRGSDARFQDILTTLYNDYKLEQDYSPAEIIAKARSLKGILEPFSTQANLDLLKRAGFVDVMSVMKYLCFEGFLAIK